jgi:hypothetical protein
MRIVSEKIGEEHEHTHSFFENLAVYGIMWKNIVERTRPQIKMWRMRFACWVHKATNSGVPRNFFGEKGGGTPGIFLKGDF